MADPTAGESNVPDPRITFAEQALEREREISRQAAAQLAALTQQEARISRTVLPQDTPITTSGWSTETAMSHLLALREGDRRFYEERDRRYAEVNVEKEKALKIKETADLAALQLAREIQTYKDEKANELREQISSERGHYASKDDLQVVADKNEEANTRNREDISRINEALARGPEGFGVLQGAVQRNEGQKQGELDTRTLILSVLLILVGVAAFISPHLH